VRDPLRQSREAARFEDQGPIADPDFQGSLQDIADLVLAAMDVEPVSRAGLERRFEEVVRTARCAAWSACA
jgi:hypothetical protein